mgnify:CR=1 FL=1
MILVSFESGWIKKSKIAPIFMILMSFESADRAGSIGGIRVKFGEICHQIKNFVKKSMIFFKKHEFNDIFFFGGV